MAVTMLMALTVPVAVPMAVLMAVPLAVTAVMVMAVMAMAAMAGVVAHLHILALSNCKGPPLCLHPLGF